MLGRVVQAHAERLGECSDRHLTVAIERIDQAHPHRLAQHS